MTLFLFYPHLNTCHLLSSSEYLSQEIMFVQRQSLSSKGSQHKHVCFRKENTFFSKEYWWPITLGRIMYLDIFVILFFIYLFFETDSCSVTRCQSPGARLQAGVQWHSHGSLQPQSLRLKRSSCLCLPTSVVPATWEAEARAPMPG